MKYYLYRGQMYNGRDLARLTGVKYTTLMARLNRGYTVDQAVADSPAIPDSIQFFIRHNNIYGFDGYTSEDFYRAYVTDTAGNYNKESHTHFMRCMKRLYPNMRIVPTRVLNSNGLPAYKRIVRFD
jgi:hypothetical protein